MLNVMSIFYVQADRFEDTTEIRVNFSAFCATPRDAINLEAVVLRSTVAGGESAVYGATVAVTRVRIRDQWLQSWYPNLWIAGDR